MKRFLRGLRSLGRFPEVLASIRVFEGGPRWALAYLRLIRTAYPATVRLRGGLGFEVLSWQDLTTVWVVVVGNEYTVRPDDRRVVDAGANIGVFSSMVTLRAKEATVVALEPFPANFERLKGTLEANGIAGRVDPKPWALVGVPGVVRMDDSPEIASHSRRVGAETGVEVEGVTLEQLLERCGWDRADLLKIDIEGAEYELFAQTPSAVLRRFDRIGLEYHGGGDSEALFAKLRDAGFRCFRHPKKGSAGVIEWERTGEIGE